MDARPVRRGRPPKSEERDTRASLLEAATSACAAHGFDGATVGEVARRAGVTATAIYNHFPSREHLLYAAGRRGLERLTEMVGAESGGAGLRGIAAASGFDGGDEVPLFGDIVDTEGALGFHHRTALGYDDSLLSCPDHELRCGGFVPTLRAIGPDEGTVVHVASNDGFIV